MKKNVALCYSGLVRNFKECIDTQIKHLIEPNKDEFNFYIFAHFWVPKDSMDYLFQNEKLKSLNVQIGSLYFDRQMKFEAPIEPDPRFPHPINNTLSMFYSMNLGYNVMHNFCANQNVKMDWVFRMRTDLFFTKDLLFKDLNPEKLYINDQYVHTDYGVNDLFSFSNPENMFKYCTTIQKIESMVNDGCAVNPECFLGFNLMKNKVDLEKIDLQKEYFELYRDL